MAEAKVNVKQHDGTCGPLMSTEDGATINPSAFGTSYWDRTLDGKRQEPTVPMNKLTETMGGRK